MTRYFLLTFAMVIAGLPTMGCDNGENRTVETQGELWDERAAFYANEDNFTDQDNEVEE